jgi:hypothetical protein
MWKAIESVPGLIAVSRVWRNLLGAEFASARPFLCPSPDLPATVPCCRCCCAHRLVSRGADRFTAVCQCSSFHCADIALHRDDVVLLEFDWIRLGRAVMRALDCTPREAGLGIDSTRQFGAFGDGLPILFTIQHDPTALLAAAKHIVARLPGPFALLVPTAGFVDAAVLAVLHSRNAAVFPLSSFIAVGEHGRLRATRRAGDLFNRLVPAPAPSDLDVAGTAYALISRLESGQPPKPPTVLSVFMMYCSENLTADQIARRCRCSKGTVVNRLKTIRQVTGMVPEELRRFSSQFERMRASVSDSRASRISLTRSAEL